MGLVSEVGAAVESEYQAKQRVMSFDQYLEMVADAPSLHLRSAANYVRDAFQYFGKQEVKYPGYTTTRYKLFDSPWESVCEPLVGQESAQQRVFRILDNFVREGATNKLILLHGPNGSAKSTLVRAVGRAMHHYSHSDEGALYKFSWVFPAEKSKRSGIGFSTKDGESTESFAHLAPELTDAKLFDELRDHPIFLVPLEQRRKLLDKWRADGVKFPDYVLNGRLSHKNRQIYEALLTSYSGHYKRVLRHIQVERFYIDHRYREADVTVEPQMSVDATERQVTMDRSVQSLPSALQYLSLHEYGGELTGANRGIIEFSDILKRPLEAYKYLLTTIESSSVSLTNATLYLDVVFIATSNEVHLHAFKQIPDFQSFRGRLELVRVPYLRNYKEEAKLYELKVREAAGQRHVAPHCALVAAMWAVLTRLRKPQPDLYPEEIRPAIASLEPMEKADLYATGEPPERLTTKVAKELKNNTKDLLDETNRYPNYEGRHGASPREMMQVLYDAAGRPDYDYVSVVALLEEIASLCEKTSVYDFLNQEVMDGYHDHSAFISNVKEKWLDLVDEEFCSAMGLIDEDEYDKVFHRYIDHIMHWTRKERVRNPTTGEYEEPDVQLMEEVEETLGADSPEDFRHDLIGRVGAWSLDNRETKPDFVAIFPKYYAKLRDAYYVEQRKPIRDGLTNFLAFLSDEKLSAADRKAAESAVKQMEDRYGYERASMREAASLLLQRYRD